VANTGQCAFAHVSSTLKGQPVCRGLRPVSEDEGILVVEWPGISTTTHHFGLNFFQSGGWMGPVQSIGWSCDATRTPLLLSYISPVFETHMTLKEFVLLDKSITYSLSSPRAMAHRPIEEVEYHMHACHGPGSDHD